MMQVRVAKNADGNVLTSEKSVLKHGEEVLKCSVQQYWFFPRKSTTNTILALRTLMEKYREGQKELHCVFVDLEKAYDTVPREEILYGIYEDIWSGKCVKVVQHTYN